jgi:hypothetical protein
VLLLDNTIWGCSHILYKLSDRFTSGQAPLVQMAMLIVSDNIYSVNLRTLPNYPRQCRSLTLQPRDLPPALPTPLVRTATPAGRRRPEWARK